MGGWQRSLDGVKLAWCTGAAQDSKQHANSNRRRIDRIKSGGSAFWWPWIPAGDSGHHPTAAWFWIHYTQPTSPLVVIITISEPTWAKQDMLVASCKVTKCLYQSDPSQFYSNWIQLSWTNILSEDSNEGNPEMVQIPLDIMLQICHHFILNVSHCITFCHYLSSFTFHPCHLSSSLLILHHLTNPEPTSISCSKRRMPGIMSCAP